MTFPRPARKEALGIVLALLMLASPIASGVAFGVGSASQSHPSEATQTDLDGAQLGQGDVEFDDSEGVTVSDGVTVWNRAIFPLRADDSTAAHRSENIRTDINVLDEDIATGLNKPTLAVYETGSPVELTFVPERSSTTKDFDGEDVQLIAARIDADQDSPDSVDDLDRSDVPESEDELDEWLADNDVPDSESELRDLLTANESATFTEVESRTIDIHEIELGGAMQDGDVFSFTPDQSGQYVLFLAAPEDGTNGFEVTDGNISNSGDVTIIGMDAVTVHDGESDVDAPDSVGAGDNATFDVDSTGASGDVNQTIILYDESEFSSATNTFIFQNATTDTDVEIETEIKDVNGVIRIENESATFITDTSDREISPSTELSAIENTLVDNRSDVTVDGDVVLNASMSAKHGPADTSMDVGVPDSWPDGEYRWIHVATTADGSIVGSNAGDITVGESDEEDTDDDNQPRRPSTPPRDDDDDDQPSPPVSVDIQTDNGQVSITIRNAEANKMVQLEVNTVGSGPASPTLDALNVSFSQTTDASLGVNGDRGSTPPVNDETDLGYFNISHDVSDETTGPVTFSFRVSAERLDERGVSPDDVVLYRYHDGEWHALETRHLGSSGGDERFEADSPGLSVFAVSTRSAQEPAFEVTDASLDTDEIEVGGTVAISATVENTGNADGTYTAELVIDGEPVEEQDVAVAAGESETITFTHSFDEAGTYDVAVGDTAAGTVEVSAADTPSDGTPTGDDTPTTEETPTLTPTDLVGGGSLAAIVLVLLVLAGAVAFLYRSGRLDEFR